MSLSFVARLKGIDFVGQLGKLRADWQSALLRMWCKLDERVNQPAAG